MSYAQLAGDKPWAGAADSDQLTMEIPDAVALSFQLAGTEFQRPAYFGVAAGAITFPRIPALSGVRLYGAFVVLDPRQPYGIATVSNALEMRLQ